MMRFMKKLIGGGLVVGFLLWGGLRCAESVLMRKIPEMLVNFSSPIISISAQNTEREKCSWKVCVLMKNMHLKVLGQDMIPVGDVRISINPLHPKTINIKTISDKKWNVDMGLSTHVFHVRYAGGSIGTFQFEASGVVDGIKNQGQLFVRTTGLKSFLNRFTEIPKWASFLVRDSQQDIVLIPKNGVLSLYGIPLIPL